MTQAEQHLAAAEDWFRKCVKAWDEAHHEGQRAYAIWQAAKEKRLRLVVEKNNAYGELEMARAAANAAKRTSGEEGRDG